MSHYILQTDANGHRWEIKLAEDGKWEHRREGRTQWLEGWPPSLPSPQEHEDGLRLDK